MEGKKKGIMEDGSGVAIAHKKTMSTPYFPEIQDLNHIAGDKELLNNRQEANVRKTKN